MNHRLTAGIFFLSLAIPFSLTADLNSFAERVQDVEESHSDDNDYSGSSTDDDDEGELVLAILSGLANLNFETYDIFSGTANDIYFPNYPFEAGYRDGKHFVRIKHASDICNEDGMDCGGLMVQDPQTGEKKPPKRTPAQERARKKRQEQHDKSYFFNLQTDYGYFFDVGHSLTVSLSGAFYKFFGPEVRTSFIFDETDLLVHSQIGLNIALLHGSHGSFMIYGQYAFMRGILTRDGGALGIKAHIFPARPFSMTINFGVEIYPRIVFVDTSFAARFHWKMLDLHIGYRVFRAQEANLDGPFIGAGFWF